MDEKTRVRLFSFVFFLMAFNCSRASCYCHRFHCVYSQHLKLVKSLKSSDIFKGEFSESLLVLEGCVLQILGGKYLEILRHLILAE